MLGGHVGPCGRSVLAVDELAAVLSARRSLAGSRQQVASEVPSPCVAVVGAGVAGLAAALSLGRRGFAVTILEAEPRPGGRIHTAKVAGSCYDLGATWVHGQGPHHNPMWEFAPAVSDSKGTPRSPQTKSPHWVRERWAMGETGEEADGAAVRLCSHAYHEALDECLRAAEGLEVRGLPGGAAAVADVGSAVAAMLSATDGAFLPGSAPVARAAAKAATIDPALAERAFRWRAQLECAISGCSEVTELSLAAWGECAELPGAAMAAKCWPGGYSALVEGAVAALPENVRLRLGRRVSSVDWGGARAATGSTGGVAGRVTVSHTGPSGDSEALEVDHAVITASLGVLKQVVAGEGSFGLTPRLPEAKVGAVRRLGFGTVDKVLLRYEQRWWEPLWDRLQLLWGDNGAGSQGSRPAALGWVRGICGLSPASHGLGLECWLAGPAAHEMEATGDSEVAEALHAVAVRCAGPLPARPPPPLGIVRSTWGSQPGFRGSYSYVPTGASGEDIDELARPEGRRAELVLAGEHTHRSHYSYSHGGWFSGLRAAADIAAHYGIERSPPAGE